MAGRDSARLTPAEGRKFGLTVGTALAVLGGLLMWRQHDQVAAALLVLAGLLVGAALFVPTRLGPVERAWMGMALAISKVTTPIFMAAVYYLVLTPVGLVLRTVGTNPLRRHRSHGTNWVEHEPGEHGSLRRQF